MLISKAFTSGTLPNKKVYVHGSDEFFDAEEAWLHGEAAEEGGQACSDAELIASQRRIILDIGKQLGRKIVAGNLNLISITLPDSMTLGCVHGVPTAAQVVMFEPRSYLQKLADPWVHPCHLEAAAAAGCPLERLKLCTTWFVAGLQHVFASWRKPFNPVLGETWQACLPSGSTICCEQISHHPPVTAFHMEGPGGVFSFDGLSQPEVSFSGGALKTCARGYRRITFASDGAIIAITYPYYRIGGLLYGTPHGLVKGTATLADAKHNLTATVTFGPVADVSSRLLSRADSFEVVIQGPSAAAAAAGAAVVRVTVSEQVKQAVAAAAARRAACHLGAAVDTAPSSAIGAKSKAAAAAAAAAPTAAAAAVSIQLQEVEKLTPQADAGLTSGSSSTGSPGQESSAVTGPAAAAAAVREAHAASKTENSLLALIFSGKYVKQLSLRRSKSEASATKVKVRTPCALQQQQQCQQEEEGQSGKEKHSNSRAGKRIAQLFVRASSSSLKTGSSSSSAERLAMLDGSRNTNSSASLPNLINRIRSNSSSSATGKRSRGIIIQQGLGLMACFRRPSTGSCDGSIHSGMLCSSSVSSSRNNGSRNSSGVADERCCTTAATAACQRTLTDHRESASLTTTAAAAALTAARSANFFETAGQGGADHGGSETGEAAAAAAAVPAAAAAGTAADTTADASAAALRTMTADAEIHVSVGAVTAAKHNSSSSSKPQTQQQQQCERTSHVSTVQRSSSSWLFSRKQQQQQQQQVSTDLSPQLQVLAVGTGCWLSHLDFDGKRYWTLINDHPESWHPLQQQQQQQCVLPSDCQTRPDLVELRAGDVKLSQQLKEHLEQQQRRDAKMRPSFPRVDCSV